MSFSIFDPVLSFLAADLEIPLERVKEGWNKSFANFFKADASILIVPAVKVTKAKTKTSTTTVTEDAKIKTKKKFPTCEYADCTTGVQNERPIEGKVYCSNHYKKLTKSLNKVESIKCNYIFPTGNKKAGMQCANNSCVNETLCKAHLNTKEVKKQSEIKTETEEESEKDEASEDEEHSEEESLSDDDKTIISEEDKSKLLTALNEDINKFMEKTVTEKNYNMAGTIAQYFKFFSTNWNIIQKIYPKIISIDSLKSLVDKKEVTKKDLYTLLKTNVSKLEQ